MIGAWTINVAGRTYGPYTAERMRAFAAEGRVGPHSLVAHEDSGDWHEAQHEPEFSEFFSRPADTPAHPAPATAPAEPAEPARAHFAIIVDLKSRAPVNLEQAFMSLGPAYKLLSNVWIVSSDQTVNAMRNRLVQELGKLDSLFVIDATRGKAAWFNFGPDADVRIRRVWQKAS